ncbi:MAG: fibronectin type III domain-containing protein [candidate division Zixibacteria bacterium]|nr:fibronectin type III domain-containing protein [candidate division Zixibacteria bacterium]
MTNSVAKFIILTVFAFVVSFAFSSYAGIPEDPGFGPPAPPSDVEAKDLTDDSGGAIQVSWESSPDDVDDNDKFNGYEILRATSLDSHFEIIGNTTAGQTEFTDNETVDGTDYYYIIRAVMGSHISESFPQGPITSSQQWFRMGRISAFIALFILSAAILYYISQAKRGAALFIRKIAGLEAVDEAVGRATEMGKKIFYVPGTQDMDNVQTIAGVTILGRVAKLCAEYETPLDVPVSRSLVMITSREIVKEAYLNAGRPDAYNDSMVHYLTDDQFGYAAGVDGMVVREQPATIFYMGAFYAESLILAETGNSVGAIQIAGTAMPAQLPFFIAACDYTLIGEELFAASAYLSKEPKLLGSLKGQDFGKLLIFIAIILGVIIQTFGWFDFAGFFNVQ